MERSFHSMLELRLIYREPGKEDLPVYVAIGEVYSPPDVLKEGPAKDYAGWAAVRVKVAEQDLNGSELPGATKLEALEHALYHVKWVLRNYKAPGKLYDAEGRPFDPDYVSPMFKSRMQMDRRLRTAKG